LKDQIAFSTVTLKIYQPETTRKELVASVVTPRPNIGLQLIESIKTRLVHPGIGAGVCGTIVEPCLTCILGFLVYLENFEENQTGTLRKHRHCAARRH
jgi:hypothetical protein